LSQSITNPPLIMSIETLNFKTRMEDGKWDLTLKSWNGKCQTSWSVLDCKLCFKKWLCDHDPKRTLDTHNPIYYKQKYVGHVDRVAFLRGIVARNK
jgi:hypothetical protein